MFVQRAAVLTALLFLGSCATPDAREGKRSGPALTAEAMAMLDRALQRPDASGVVIDLAAIEEAGFASRTAAIQQTAQLLTTSVPWIVASEDDQELRQFFGRLTVASAILREWADWPNVRGLAVSIPDVAATAQTGRPGSAVIVLALAQDEQNNRQLLEGVLALGRASLAEEHGRDVSFEVRGGDACVTEKSGTLCVRSGNGYLLMGTQEAMSTYASAAAPAAGAIVSSMSAAEAQAEPVLLHARISMRQQGTANVFVRGKERLAVFASVESPSPMMPSRIDQVVREQVQRYDEQRVLQRQLVAESLAKMKAQLAADPSAPPRMKQIADGLTPDKVLDPQGHWQQIRASLKTELVGQRYAASLVVPAAAVDDLQATLDDGGGASVAVMGALAAIAIPNFIKFQCRAKQSEAASSLRAIQSSQRASAAEKGRYGRTFKELGFRPESSARYVYCMGQECTACTGPQCTQVLGENPCSGLSGVGKTLQEGFQICAYGNLDGDPVLDVWVVDERGAPENGENDCVE